MSDTPMALREEDVRRIGEYVKPWLREYVSELLPARAGTAESRVLERILHVEEELRLQRELMDVRFQAVDRRFEIMQTSIDQRFEGVDKRFESVDKRFDDMQHSFARTQWLMGIGFVMLTAAVTVFGLLG